MYSGFGRFVIFASVLCSKHKRFLNYMRRIFFFFFWGGSLSLRMPELDIEGSRVWVASIALPPSSSSFYRYRHYRFYDRQPLCGREVPERRSLCGQHDVTFWLHLYLPHRHYRNPLRRYVALGRTRLLSKLKFFPWKTFSFPGESQQRQICPV